MPDSVSIVIPTYNQRWPYLSSAVLSAVSQTVRCEIIVVDDGSDERIDMRAHPLQDRVSIIRHPENRGIAAALNTGIKAMTGEWFCWLPSDDLFAPEKVERQLEAVLSAGRRASYHRYYWTTQEDGTPERVSIENRMETWKHQKQRLSSGCVINGMTVMLHRSVFDDVGVFDESYVIAQDWELWCRVARREEWLYLPDILGTRRTSGNFTEQVEKSAELSALHRAEIARVKASWL
jgi:glycosyltransferase involved in cell wall biosynthesis